MDEISTRTFPAMGTTIHVIGPAGDERATDRAEAIVSRVFEAAEQTFSRFRPDSELSLVNASAGSSTVISADLAAVVELALDASKATGGLFDPTVLGALVAAGYDRDFELVRQRGQVPAPLGDPRAASRWAEIELDERTVTMPPDVGLDLGGIAKGWTVDRAAEGVDLPWVLIDAGGDMRLVGEPDGPLHIAVDDPTTHGEEVARIVMPSGAIATSTSRRRAWGEGLHHLIDPRTGLPSTSSVVQATVWSETCAAAEVAAKFVLLKGPDAIAQIPSLAVLDDGEVVSSLPVAQGRAA